MTFSKIDLQNKKAVFLDIDDTLYRYKKAHNIAIELCEQKLNEVENFKDEYRKYRNIITQRLKPTGACRSRLLAFMEMFEDLKLDNPYSKALYFDKFYWDNLINNIEINKDAELFIDTCVQQKINIIITTDMLASIQIQKLDKLGVLSKISFLVTSEQVGCQKSEPAFFKFLLNKYKLNPKDVICVGDDKLKDYDIPSSLGITSYIVTMENNK